MLGISVASVLVALIGTGSLQIGLMVVLAMSAAVLLRGGELLVAESAVSAILLVSLDPNTSDVSFTLNRVLEGLIGGGVALAVTSLVFPPDPALHVGRAAQAVFSGLGAALERLAAALAARDPGAAGEALADGAGAGRARSTSSTRRCGTGPRDRVAVAATAGRAAPTSNATARASPRSTSRSATPACSRATRCGCCAPASRSTRRCRRPCASSASRVWSLAGAYEQPERADAVRGHALRAGALAGEEVGRRARSRPRSARPRSISAAPPTCSRRREGAEAPTEELLAAVPV